MLLLFPRRKWLAVAALAAAARFSAMGQFAILPDGGEYPIAGSIPGDQTQSSIAINKSGGYVVWQDNATDEDGFGISARRLNQNLSGFFPVFRVNVRTRGDQETPKVAMLKNGGAIFVWRSAQTNIVARVVGADGTFLSNNEIVVADGGGNLRQAPAMAVLADGNVAVVWASDREDGSMQGVYGQILSPAGAKVGFPFRVNQTTLFNQRTPAVAALADGKFVVAWVSESGSEALGLFSIDVFARICSPDGPVRTLSEFRVNDQKAMCANPAVAGTSDGFFTIAWSQRKRQVETEQTAPSQGGASLYVTADEVSDTDSWDVYSRSFAADATARGLSVRVNEHIFGPQFSPQMSAVGSDVLVVWTSFGQDGAQEGIYGRFMGSDSRFHGAETRVNTVTASKQIQPSVASDGDQRSIVVWSSFIGGPASVDLFAQRLSSAPALLAPTPVVSALNQTRLSVAWPEVQGYGAVTYSLFMDQDATPATVSNNYWVATRLSPNSTHSFRLKFSLSDGRESSLSVAASGKTWDEDDNQDSLPDDWQRAFWGDTGWPGAGVDSDGDGATNLEEFLAGTDPKDPRSLLRTFVTSSGQGRLLNWNTIRGSIYQVQTSTDLKSWTNAGAPRFATGNSDSTLLNLAPGKAYFRVIRLR